MTLVWIFWRAASKTSQGVVVLVVLAVASPERARVCRRTWTERAVLGVMWPWGGGAADARVE